MWIIFPLEWEFPAVFFFVLNPNVIFHRANQYSVVCSIYFRVNFNGIHFSSSGDVYIPGLKIISDIDLIVN